MRKGQGSTNSNISDMSMFRAAKELFVEENGGCKSEKHERSDEAENDLAVSVQVFNSTKKVIKFISLTVSFLPLQFHFSLLSSVRILNSCRFGRRIPE